MIEYENECCGCATSSYPCIGSACKNLRVPHLYCDRCEHEVEELRNVYGEQLCNDCINKEFPLVEVE